MSTAGWRRESKTRMSEKPAGGALAVTGLVATALLWGMMIPMTHVLATRHLDPFFVSAVRYLIPAPLLLALALIYDRKWPFRAPMPWSKVLRLGIAMSLFSLCFTIGIMLSEPVRAAIVMSATAKLKIPAEVPGGARLQSRNEKPAVVNPASRICERTPHGYMRGAATTIEQVADCVAV